MANGPHLLENLLHRAIAPEAMQRLGLVLQQLGQLVGFLVWRGEREQRHCPGLRLVCRHGRLQLDPPALGNLGRTDWASPDTPAGLQASIGGRAVFVVFPHLNVRVECPDSQALGRPALGQY